MSILSRFKHGLNLMITRAISALIDDTGKLQLWQVDGLADETLDDVERFGSYGFASLPHPGAEAIVASVGGARSHGVVIACEDRRYRLKDLKNGEAALYDDLGQVVYLTRDGIVIKSPLPVMIESETSLDFLAPEITMTANTMTIDADTLTTTGETLLGGGGKAIARHDDPIVAGKIVASSTKVEAG